MGSQGVGDPTLILKSVPLYIPRIEYIIKVLFEDYLPKALIRLLYIYQIES